MQMMIDEICLVDKRQIETCGIDTNKETTGVQDRHTQHS
jgi:hypothetical protein